MVNFARLGVRAAAHNTVHMTYIVIKIASINPRTMSTHIGESTQEEKKQTHRLNNPCTRPGGKHQMIIHYNVTPANANKIGEEIERTTYRSTSNSSGTLRYRKASGTMPLSTSACACPCVRGKPSSSQPRVLQSSSAKRSITMPMMRSSGTS